MSKRPLTEWERGIAWIAILYLVVAPLLAAAIFLLAGCGGQPGCADNPRNIQCFTADELQRELNK